MTKDFRKLDIVEIIINLRVFELPKHIALKMVIGSPHLLQKAFIDLY